MLIPWFAALAAVCLAALPLQGAEVPYRPAQRDLGFVVYTNAPLGRQVSGQHAPAPTPALSPEESQRLFQTPEGFEVRLFASEPEVVNPVAMTWDARGRLWVLELYEYPEGAAEGTTPRDRIKILEDTDADGRADRVHVWADGLNLATGLVLGNGGAYVGATPDLLFLEDTDGDDRADKRTVVKTGFGREDTHELLNGFAWGPDGQLYMTHGVFTRSEVRDPGAAEEDSVVLTAGVARWSPVSGKFEVFAEGTSNPWGVDFDRWGNAFVSACVIEHLFHLVPGGIYDRQAGVEPHPYAYERLKAINDHRHHMAAYAGVQVYQGNQYPAENQGTILQGNIHDHSVHQDTLKPRGSTLVASAWRDLVRTEDGWFMPVSVQVGPDGAVWIMDWYDRYPCYQNARADPAGVDREHGRIWRVVHTGGDRGRPVPSRPSRHLDLEQLPSAELVGVLAHPNVWQRRTAQRILNHRRDDKVMGLLQEQFRTGADQDTRLASFWTLHSSGYLADDVLGAAVGDGDAAVRAWAARFIGERGVLDARALGWLDRLARDGDARVRLEVAVACRQFSSSQLTVNRPPAVDPAGVGAILALLAGAPGAGDDPVLPFMIWHASEPMFARNPEPGLRWLAANGGRFQTMSGILIRKAMRRLCDLGTPEAMDMAMALVTDVSVVWRELEWAALESLVKGQEGRVIRPTRTPQAVGSWLEDLMVTGDARVRDAALQLGVLWGDAGAMGRLRRLALDGQADPERRLKALSALRRTADPVARETLLTVAGDGATPERVALEAVRGLGEMGGDGVAARLVEVWGGLAPAVRRLAAETMISRPAWLGVLLAAMEAKQVPVADLSPSALRSLRGQREASVQERVQQVVGRIRESGRDKADLVAAKRKVVMEGEPDLARGRELATQLCLNCHQLLGEGEQVGPDLTGVGRSSVDALLWNVIDPNQVIGGGYEQVEVETTDGRSLAGRLMEDSEVRVRLLLQGGREEVVARGEVASMEVSELSVMPEGLWDLPDADLRSLIWYLLAPPAEGPLTTEKRARLAQ